MSENDPLAGRFDLLDLLGEGGAGTVYRAKDRQLGRIVAVKFPRLAGDRQTLLAEAGAAAVLNHPNIAVVYDVLGGSRPCIVMEYVAGETIEERVARGPLPVEEAIDLTCQIVSALVAAHDEGWLHGDLTTANVRISPDGQAKLLDFGLARRARRAEGDVFLRQGTLRYMAPERLAGRGPEIGSDLFAAGVLLYEMLTGCRPFEGDSLPALTSAIRFDEPRSFGSLGCEAPLEAERIVRRALDKDPERRYATAADLLADLSGLKQRLAQPSADRRDVAREAPAKPERWWRSVLRRAFGRSGLRGLTTRASAPSTGAAFRGLVPFHEADSDSFLGREQETALFVDRIRHGEFRLGILFGDSGCGKTSLMQAGLIPRFRSQGELPLYCRSYRDPVTALLDECRKATAIDPFPGEPPVEYFHRVARAENTTVILLCDQFEEFFVSLRSAEEREPFLDFLAQCHARAGASIKCLIAIRADFLHLIASHLGRRIADPLGNSRLFRLGNLDTQQAERIIATSAERARLAFEPGLARRVAQDLATGDLVVPSELQILGEQLQRRQVLTVAAYSRLGKEELVIGFLDDVLASAEDRERAALLLRCLISDEDTRLTLPADEIARRTQSSREAASRLLQYLVGARLIREIQDEEPWRYELVHEYLIERINRITGRVMDATQRANRLIRQYVAQAVLDPATRIPLRRVWFIRRYSDVPFGEKERRLLTVSRRRGLWRGAAAALLVAVSVVTLSAALSRTEEWEESLLSDGHTAAVRRVVFSPDGRLLASASEDKTVIVWDFARRERRATLTGHTGAVSALAFSPDGKWLVSGGHDSAVLVWETTTFTRTTTLTGHVGVLGSLAFSPDGKLLASSASETIVWSVESWSRARVVSTFGAGDHSSAFFSPDARRLYVGHAWMDIVSGREHFDLVGCQGNVFAPSPNNKRRIAALDSEGYLRLCDDDGKLLWLDRAHRDHGRGLAWSNDGRWMATGSDDLVLWDADTRSKVTHFDYPSVVWSCAFSPTDGRWLVSSHGDGSIVLWDVVERVRVARFGGHAAPVRAVAFSIDGRAVVSASEDRSLIVWDVDSRRQRAVLLAHSTRLMGAAFVPGTGDVVSSDQDDTVIVWDMQNHRPRRTLTPATRVLNASFCLVVSPDARWVSNCRSVFRMSDGALVADPDALCGRGGAWGMAFSFDSQWLALPCDDRVELWKAGTWHAAETRRFNHRRPTTLAFSPDDHWLATGDDDGDVRLYATAPFREAGRIGHHEARIKSVAFSPDGAYVASASDDRTISLWDVSRRRLATRIGTHTAPVLAVAFSQDGRHLVSGEHDRSVRLYTLHHKLWGYRLD